MTKKVVKFRNVYYICSTKPKHMTTPKFNQAYVNANKLQIGSTFDYIGVAYIVTGFTKIGIIAERVISQKPRKFDVFKFEGYIYHGFLQINKF